MAQRVGNTGTSLSLAPRQAALTTGRRWHQLQCAWNSSPRLQGKECFSENISGVECGIGPGGSSHMPPQHEMQRMQPCLPLLPPVAFCISARTAELVGEESSAM